MTTLLSKKQQQELKKIIQGLEEDGGGNSYDNICDQLAEYKIRFRAHALDQAEANYLIGILQDLIQEAQMRVRK